MINDSSSRSARAHARYDEASRRCSRATAARPTIAVSRGRRQSSRDPAVVRARTSHGFRAKPGNIGRRDCVAPEAVTSDLPTCGTLTMSVPSDGRASTGASTRLDATPEKFFDSKLTPASKPA